MITYQVFVRNWWRRDRCSDGTRQLVPDPGARKTFLARGLTEGEARLMCHTYNLAHEPGILSRKAEYTEE